MGGRALGCVLRKFDGMGGRALAADVCWGNDGMGGRAKGRAPHQRQEILFPNTLYSPHHLYHVRAGIASRRESKSFVELLLSLGECKNNNDPPPRAACQGVAAVHRATQEGGGAHPCMVHCRRRASDKKTRPLVEIVGDPRK
eukprot:gene7892-biopygen18082